jgi:hypothetical protein
MPDDLSELNKRKVEAVMHDTYKIEIYFDRNVYNWQVISTGVIGLV